jgi:hypothetical protein
MWSTRRLNDMDPCPWFAIRSPPMWRDIRAAGDPPLSGSALGPSRSEPTGGMVRLDSSV